MVHDVRPLTRIRERSYIIKIFYEPFPDSLHYPSLETVRLSPVARSVSSHRAATTRAERAATSNVFLPVEFV